ncbi:hypothetical protein D3C77_325110 [compost metagenome]
MPKPLVDFRRVRRAFWRHAKHLKVFTRKNGAARRCCSFEQRRSGRAQNLTASGHSEAHRIYEQELETHCGTFGQTPSVRNGSLAGFKKARYSASFAGIGCPVASRFVRGAAIGRLMRGFGRADGTMVRSITREATKVWPQGSSPSTFRHWKRSSR